MIEPNCDMPWEIYLDWLQDQGNEDLRFVDCNCLTGTPMGYFSFADCGDAMIGRVRFCAEGLFAYCRADGEYTSDLGFADGLTSDELGDVSGEGVIFQRDVDRGDAVTN